MRVGRSYLKNGGSDRTMTRTHKSSKILFLLPLFLSFVSVGCGHGVVGHRTLSKEGIVKVAAAKASEEGVNLNEVSVLYDTDNVRWDKVSRTLSTPETKRHLDVLRRRDFQAVAFTPRRRMLGGVLWVFIDRQTGRVITWYGEE